MAFHKKKFHRRKTAHKKTVKQKVNKLMRIVKQDRPEVKYIDFVIAGQNFDSINGLVFNVTNGIAQGTLDTQRVGDKVRLLSLNLKGYIQGSATAASTSNQSSKLMIFKGIGENLTQYTSSIMTATNGLGHGYAPFTPVSYDQKSLIKPLFQKHFNVCAGWSDVNTGLNNAGFAPRHEYSIFKKLNYETTYFQATTGVVNGGLYLYYISDTLSANNPPNTTAYGRLYYVDA